MKNPVPTDLHLSEARAWIERNGVPKTDAQMREMARFVVTSAAEKTQAMANSVFLALGAAAEDQKHGVNTLHGDKGRDFLNMILEMVKT